MTEIRVDPEDWDLIVPQAEGPQLVVAGPGAGKTEFLVRRARHLIERGTPTDSVLLLSFSRRGASALRDRVTSGLDRSFTSIPASTFHSLAMRVVEAHGGAGDWPRVPTLLTGPEQVEMVARLLGSEDPRRWPSTLRPLLPSRNFAEEVADFVLRASERLMGPSEIDALGRDDWRPLPGFLARYRTALIAANRIDYGSLQVEAVRLLEDPVVATAVGGGFGHVLVDEFQDTTVAQARLLELLVASHRNITAAGDPYQSVYSFRGAELSNVADFPDRFRDARGEPARRIVLTTSFRVPAAILDAAVRLTEGAGLPGAAGPVVAAPGSGSVETHGFREQSGETEWIAAEIDRVRLRDGVPLHRIGILVRSKRRFLGEMSRVLDSHRIPHLRPDTRLGDHACVRPILDLAGTAAEPTPAGVRRLALGMLGRLGLAAARQLEHQAVAESPEAALRSAEATAPLADLVADPGWATRLPAVEGFWRAWIGLPALGEMALHDAEARRALTAFSQALGRLAERDPTVTLAGYSALLDSEDFEAEPLLASLPDDDRVVLATLHQAKGMEFDVVFIADAREGVLPDLRRRDSILGTRHLSPTLTGDDHAYRRFRVQEERRLAYTAMCRARARVVWTATTDGDPERITGGGPSRFLSLVSGLPLEEAANPPPLRHDPTTAAEVEAWLRRRVSDPSMPDVERLAALGAIAANTWWRPRHPERFAGIEAPGTDHGVLTGRHRLSPSQAESYLRCPRRYVFERHLGVGGATTVYQALGSLLHGVLETVERRAAATGREHAAATEAVACLDDQFDPSEFGGEPWAASWRRHAEAILRHLYALWPGKGPGVEFERDVELVLDGITWRGRIDRVEQRGEGLHVIDYKTGATPATKAEAGASIQLGFYTMALGPEVAGAEFWYPGHQPGDRKSVAVREFDLGTLDEVENAMRNAQVGILAEEWRPTPGSHCEGCAVRIVCPMWPEGREAFAS
ncbi:MAG: ATP-dependent DNA helicase [Acidimicrobiia bacterium]|nr:MAG: ATP-dependent DNA helicase [Acidimicrobiia bacterium]